MLIQIPDATAPTEYRFPLHLPDGAHAVPFDDGSVIITDATGKPTGGFRAPWAVDATGNPVPTSFRIDGTDLIQTVAFTPETAFLITADPDFGSEWWGWYVQHTKAETLRLSQLVSEHQAAAVVAGAACGAVPAGIGIAACSAAIVLIYAKFIDPATRAANAGTCVALNLPWAAISQPGVFPPKVLTVGCRS